MRSQCDTLQQSKQLWKFVKSWCRATSVNISCDGSIKWQECHTKCQLGKSCWLHLQESSPEVDQGSGGYISNQAWSHPAMAQAELADISDNCWNQVLLTVFLQPNNELWKSSSTCKWDLDASVECSGCTRKGQDHHKGVQTLG